MGKNKSKNKRKQEKQTRKEKEQEEKLKPENIDLVSSPQSKNQCVLDNWYDEDESHWEKVVGKKRPETLKNQPKNVESMEVEDKPSTKNRKKSKQMNSLQDFDHNMECEEEGWPDNPSSRKDNSRDRNRNHSPNRRKDSRNRDGNLSSDRREDDSHDKCKKDNFHDRDSRNDSDYRSNRKPPTKNRKKSKQLNSHQDSDHNMECAEEDQLENSLSRKDRSRERNRNNSSHRRNDTGTRDDGYSLHRPDDNLRHGHHNKNRKDKFNDRGSRNDSDHRRKYPEKDHSRNQRGTRNEDSRYGHSHYNDKSSGRANNHRNENPNNRHLEDKKYKPPHRSQGHENQNSFEKGNSPYEKRIHTNQNGESRQSRWNQTPEFDKQNENTSVKSKKKNKQGLFVPNANLYEPTIREIEGDLFESSEEYSLAHCVAEDLSMGAGIAVKFKKLFKGVKQLSEQNKRVGEVAILQKENRFIFYLITKKQSYGKPTINSFTTAIQSLKQSCLELNVKKLAIPRIGCGLDRLDWGEVKDILYDEFSTTDIEIVVYVW